MQTAPSTSFAVRTNRGLTKIAKEQGAIVVGMVSTPFDVERARTVKSEESLEKLDDRADSIIGRELLIERGRDRSPLERRR